MTKCNYPNCDGGYATGWCHSDCPAFAGSLQEKIASGAPNIEPPCAECGHDPAVAKELLAALELAADHIRDLDGGDPSTETGWKSDESLDVWLKARRALGTRP